MEAGGGEEGIVLFVIGFTQIKDEFIKGSGKECG